MPTIPSSSSYQTLRITPQKTSGANALLTPHQSNIPKPNIRNSPSSNSFTINNNNNNNSPTSNNNHANHEAEYSGKK